MREKIVLRLVVWSGLAALLLIGFQQALSTRYGSAAAEGREDAVWRMAQEYRVQYEAPDISVEELLTKRREGVPLVLVDARSAEEREVSVIPGAISREEYEAEALGYSGQLVVVYCTIGLRSGKYADLLRKQGVDAVNLYGSALAWAWAKQDFASPSGDRVKRLHVFGKQWDLAPRDYETVY